MVERERDKEWTKTESPKSENNSTKFFWIFNFSFHYMHLSLYISYTSLLIILHPLFFMHEIKTWCWSGFVKTNWMFWCQIGILITIVTMICEKCTFSSLCFKSINVFYECWWNNNQSEQFYWKQNKEHYTR